MEKKLTDEEIVNALERCIKGVNFSECAECPLDMIDEDCCIYNPTLIDRYALDLIHRQKAEIERLTREVCKQKNFVSAWEESWKIANEQNTKIRVKLKKENAELQKQVDELRGQVLIAKLQGLTEGYLDGVQAERNAQIIKPAVVELPKEIVDKIREKVEKDTAKEILQMIDDDRSGYWDSCDCGKDETYWRDNSIQGTLNEIKKRYGVEVEL